MKIKQVFLEGFRVFVLWWQKIAFRRGLKSKNNSRVT